MAVDDSCASSSPMFPLAFLNCEKKKKMMAAEKTAGIEASITFSAKYVKRGLEVTDSTEAATFRELSTPTGGRAEREMSEGLAWDLPMVFGIGVTNADEPSIEARAIATAKTVDVSNFIVGCSAIFENNVVVGKKKVLT